jgi:putative glutamine amidotransferase
MFRGQGTALTFIPAGSRLTAGCRCDFRFSIFDCRLQRRGSALSPICNLQSKIENRKSKIENRKWSPPVASRPLIGLPAQTLEAIPGQVPRAWVIGQQYVRALAAAGALPWPLPLLIEDEATLRAIYDRLDGVFLAGGADVDPGHYDEARADGCGEADPPRDRTELLLARWAVAEGKPLFGVCRGCQLINVACGGSLYQDLPSQCASPLRHDHFSKDMVHDRDRRTHHVRVEPGTLLARLLGRAEVEVNSMHHQGVRRLAPGLRATAFAPDGLVEGFEGASPFLLGVQWHPEELVETDEASRRLFAGFVEASRGSKGP